MKRKTGQKVIHAYNFFSTELKIVPYKIITYLNDDNATLIFKTLIFKKGI